MATKTHHKKGLAPRDLGEMFSTPGARSVASATAIAGMLKKHAACRKPISMFRMKKTGKQVWVKTDILGPRERVTTVYLPEED